MALLSVLPVVWAPGCADLRCGDGTAAWLERPKAPPQSFSDLDSPREANLTDGDTLHICPGTWAMSADYEGQAEGDRISVVGAGTDVSVLTGEPGGSAGGAEAPGVFTFSDLTFRDVVVIAAGDSDAGEPAAETGGAGFAAASDVTLDSVVIQSNSADLGAGLLVFEGATVTIRNSRVIRNRAFPSGDVFAGGGGAALLGTSGILVSENTDWGEGDDDNTPDDVALWHVNGDELGSYTFGDNASFTCDLSLGTCL